MRQKLYYIIPAAIVIGLVFWRLAVNRHDKAAQLEAANARKKAPVNVQIATAVVRDITHVFQGVGDVEAPADVKIAPKVTGRLDFLQVREGDRVTKGQVLARIDPSQAQAAVNQQQAAVESARTNLGNAQVKYNRYHSLYTQGFVAAQDVDDYRTQMEVQQSALRAAEAQLRNVQSQLSDTILRSPINGFVTARSLDPGSVVTAGQAIINVQAIRNVYVTTSVPEGVNRSIHPGMEATVTFDAMPNREFKGKVRQVNTSADPQSRQFLVRAALDNGQNLIRPGMFCRVSIVTQVTHNAVVIPQEAIKPGKNGQTVTVVDNQLKAHATVVKTGDRDPSGVQILEGVKDGDKVVVLSAQPVKDGQLVKIDKGGTQQQAAVQPAVVGGGGGIGGGAGSSGGGASAPTYGGGSSGAISGGNTNQGSGGSDSGGSTSRSGNVTPGTNAPTGTNGAGGGVGSQSGPVGGVTSPGVGTSSNPGTGVNSSLGGAGSATSGSRSTGAGAATGSGAGGR